MKHKLRLTLLAHCCAILAACTGGQQTITSEPPAPTREESVQEASRPPLVIEDDKLYVAIIWHQHQPVYYKDEASNIYERPWVRVHAAKDYVDMAAMLMQYPDVHATFNLTPSLIRQLDDIEAGARDLYWVMAEVPASELDRAQKLFILNRFFDINPKIIERFPRYAELARMRTGADLEEWQEQDWLDLQVLFNLAWTDPDWLAQQPLASLVEQGRDFSESDKQIVFEEHLRLVREVIPLHAEMQRDGQIEVTMTPFAHPILPLLVDSNLAQVALPEADLPTRFVYGQDAVAQVELGVEFYEKHFGLPPRGMWPAEGSVAENIIAMVANAGVQWMASDEEVLAESLPDVETFTRDSSDVVLQADELYRPYDVQGARGGPVAVIFRDHVLSDKVGFEYSGTPGDVAAADLIGRLEAIYEQLTNEGAEGPHLVTVLLDGENAWEYYDNDGKEFLHETYRLLSESQTLVTVTPSEYLNALDAAGESRPVIEELWPGSWIDGTFSTWIGEEEENQAWEYLRRTRAAVQNVAPDLDELTLERVMELVYIAEGSDWFWWYGADQNSGADDSFDRQFRAYLERIYELIGDEVPDYVRVPVIPERAQTPDRAPTGMLSVISDGQPGEDEWEAAGYYSLAGIDLKSLYYGFDQEQLYIRLDSAEGFSDDWTLGFYVSPPAAGTTNAYSRYGSGETRLGFGVKRLIEITFQSGEPRLMIYRADGTGSWIPTAAPENAQPAAAASQGSLEMAIPMEAFAPDPRSGDRIHVRLVLSKGEQDLAIFPGDGPAVATVPDLPIPNVFAVFEDPATDDHGPGTYDYPSDQVFKSGVFDLTGLTIGYDEQDMIFRLEFRGPVVNEWGSPNGLSIQTIDLYIDTDGAETGDRVLLPGRNAALEPGHGWDYAIWAEGWTPGIYTPGSEGPVQVDSGYRIVTNPGQRRVTIYVPRTLIEPDPENWHIAVAILSQEGYPSAGVWRVRDVQPSAAQWRIGGGTGSPADTRIMDILWPPGETPTQEELLQNPNAPGVSLKDLTVDDLAQVPMLATGDGS
ncbi:MAG: glucodextranase DOMON-like domain-containing protein [Anaerolineales bacterium]|nr:glucodextranase DOMON-like domain-containing protein [Anaerolineales bacterium]